jgi:hypothetical protein
MQPGNTLDKQALRAATSAGRALDVLHLYRHRAAAVAVQRSAIAYAECSRQHADFAEQKNTNDFSADMKLADDTTHRIIAQQATRYVRAIIASTVHCSLC